MNRILRLALIGSLGLATAAKAAERQTETRHGWLIAGPTLTGMLDESAEVAWNTGRKFARDIWQLPGGNVLVCWSNVVKEFDLESGDVVFEYPKEPGEDYFGSAHRLSSGNTLIRIRSREPRVIEVTPKGEVARSVPLKYVSATASQTILVRKIEGNRFLAPFIGGKQFMLLEYTFDGEVARELTTKISTAGDSVIARRSTTNAIRLPNGNTLISSEVRDMVAEVDADGKMVWQLSNDDLPQPLMNHVTGIQRLPGGNTVVSSYKATGDEVKAFEVNPQKKVVWQYSGPYRVFRFQIISTNSKPLNGPALR